MSIFQHAWKILTIVALTQSLWALPAAEQRGVIQAADGTNVPVGVRQTQATATVGPTATAPVQEEEEESGIKKALPFIAIAGVVGLGCLAALGDNNTSQLTGLSTDLNNTFEADSRTRPAYPLRTSRGEEIVDSSPPETPLVRDDLDKYITEKIDKELFKDFDSAQDAEKFCPKYHSLNREQKVKMWTTVNTAIIQYESGWRPTDRMTEVGFGKPDPITGKQVVSEGLYALSYQDMQQYPFCKFDWEKDRQYYKFNKKDPRISILDPKINIDCGIKILAHKIRNEGNAIVKHCHKGDRRPCAYWSVLSTPGTHGNSKVRQITQLTKKLPFCQ